MDHAPNHWITRIEAGSILNCTYATVRDLERRGFLHSRKSVDGVCKYDPEEVAELAKTYTPQLGRPPKPIIEATAHAARRHNKRFLVAAIIEHIEAGHSRAHIVKQLRVSFEEIDEVYVKMNAPLGSLETPEARKERQRKERYEQELRLATASLQEKSLETLNGKKK